MKKLNPATMMLSAFMILAAGGMLMANQLSDRIESSAKKTYVFKTYLKDDNVNVKATDNGVVTLTGSVAIWSHRSLAEETVSGLPGVTRVENQLDSKGGERDQTTDAWVTMKIKTMLMFHRNVSTLKTEVDVTNGVATLRGEASSEAQKELTTEYVNDIEGVKSVSNRLSVQKNAKTSVDKIGDNIDDASITAQVKMALLFHRSTSAFKISVGTKEGVVTVSGVAKNGAEKDLVEKLAADIKGVKSIENKITIG